jgi:hypothetical protein
MEQQHDSVIRLGTHFAAVDLPLSDANADRLKAEVFAFVDEAKALGWPPERVIIAVKRTANAAGLAASARVAYSGAALSEMDKLMIKLVGWCIERYFHRMD